MHKLCVEIFTTRIDLQRFEYGLSLHLNVQRIILHFLYSRWVQAH